MFYLLSNDQQRSTELRSFSSSLPPLFSFQAAIRKELNEFKSSEMEVHEESRIYTRSGLCTIQPWIICLCRFIPPINHFCVLLLQVPPAVAALTARGRWPAPSSCSWNPNVKLPVRFLFCFVFGFSLVFHRLPANKKRGQRPSLLLEPKAGEAANQLSLEWFSEISQYSDCGIFTLLDWVRWWWWRGMGGGGGWATWCQHWRARRTLPLLEGGCSKAFN